MKRKNGNFITALLIFIFLLGLSLLLYPSVADYWNSLHATKAISAYAEALAQIDETDYEAYKEAALEYNRSLLQRTNPFATTDRHRALYPEMLNIDGSGIMGYIDIPSIELTLPLYHGTSEKVLQTGIGHLDWTSLPIGGESSHCVLSGHRGLPSAKLFTNLDRLVVGDLFYLRVLNEVLTYEVDQILIVLPEEITALQITEGEDYCTLVTCTPYGINTHRMLVRGHRIDTEEEAAIVRVTSEAVQIEAAIVAPVIAVPLLVILVSAVMTTGRKRKKRSMIKEEMS